MSEARDPSVPEGETARPSARSHEHRSNQTRQRILAAAHAIFVREGFAGTKIEHVALAAQANKRLVYHHFGSKDELFTAVLENAYAAMRVAEQKLGLERLAPLEAITRLVTFTWHYYHEHEDFISLVATENLCKAEHLRTSDRIPQLSSSLERLVAETVTRGEREGAFRSDIDPVQLWISIAGLCWFSVANRHTIAATFERAATRPPIESGRLAHILGVVHAFLSPVPDTSPWSRAKPVE